MVWSQYVYEANTGFDADASDDDEYNDNTPLNIEDWEVEYSDELQMMWNTIRTLLYDAQIEHSGKFCDFVEFCYTDHNSHIERVHTDHDEVLDYIWKHVRRIVNNNGLHEEMMRGASYHHFTDFVENYMYLY
jgi:hypothetical protein